MRRRTARSRGGQLAVALAVLFARVPATGDSRAQSPYLYVVDLSQAREGIDFSRPLRFEAYATDPAALGRKLAPMLYARGIDHVVLEARSYPVLPPSDPSAFLAATFVVDFDQPAVAALAAALRERYGDAPAADQIVAFVRDSIDSTSARGFDIASQVAAHRAGDCTEHAVLFTALARSVGMPARIVSGILIARIGDELAALGHAWAETHDGSRWRPIDPTDVRGAEPLVYVPDGILENEGPGYAFGLARIYQSGIERIVVLENRAPGK